MTSEFRRLLAFLPCVICVAGCAVGPDYQRPALDIPNTFRYASADADVVDSADVEWWSQFNEPVLTELIQRGLRQNKDLAIAAARVDAFYGRLMTTRAGMFPQINADFAGGRSRSVPSPGFGPTVGNQVQLDLMVSWELDFFGRLRRMTEGARADYLGTQAAQQATRVALISSVATGYLLLRDLDQRLDIAQSTLNSRADALALFQTRYGGGVVSQLQVSQAMSEYQSAQASVYAFRQQIAQQENALSLLLGDNPGPIPRGKPLTALSSPVIPVGIPSSLLERRPDVVQAEQALISANASVGAARARYYPDISLTGLLGTASSALSGLWSGPARIWSFAGAVSQPIFTGGAIEGGVRTAEAQKQQALLAYQQTIQSAFADVENALVATASTKYQFRATNLQVDAFVQYAFFARDLY